MKSIQGTITEKNLLKAFAGESQARNRYTYFAERAREEGYIQIADIFDETAGQEREHARRFFNFLKGGNLEITATYPAGVLRTTLENLEEAAAGEYEEWHRLYPDFAAQARAEGFGAIAAIWEHICVSERQHERRYRALLNNIRNGTVFRKSQPVVWRCRNCGFLHEAVDAPGLCPACAYPQAYFEVLAENW